MRWKRVAGMSVLEVLVAITVLAVAGLGLIAALTRLMFAQSSSSHQTVARLLAQGKLEDAVLAGPPNWGRSSTGEPESVWLKIGQGSAPTEFRIAPPVDSWLRKSPVLSSGIPMGEVYEIQVEVTWHGAEDSTVAGVERGRRSVSVSKVTYIED